MLQVPACPAVPQLPHVLMLMLMISACSACLPACLPLLPQVFELSAAIDSTLVWQEVCLLAQCRHERIVPLRGVAVKVSSSCYIPLLVVAGTCSHPATHFNSLCQQWPCRHCQLCPAALHA